MAKIKLIFFNRNEEDLFKLQHCLGQRAVVRGPLMVAWVAMTSLPAYDRQPALRVFSLCKSYKSIMTNYDTPIV